LEASDSKYAGSCENSPTAGTAGRIVTDEDDS